MNFGIDRMSYIVSLFPRIKELIECADGIILTGSCARGDNTASSDIDIIIISKKVNYPYCESLKDDNQIIQFIFFPYYKLPILITNDLLYGNGIYTEMLREGRIWKDDAKNTLRRIKDYVMNESHLYQNEQVNYALISKMTQCLNVLKTGSSNVEKVFCASEILFDITRLITHKYQFDGKHLARITQNNKRGRDIIEAYERLVCINETEAFINVVCKSIDEFGGLQEKYTTGWVYTLPPTDHIMILFPSQSLANFKVWKYIRVLQKIAKGCVVHTFYIGKNQLMEEGTYMFLYLKNRSSARLLSQLNKFRSNVVCDMLKQGLHCTFPYKTLFHEGVSFGGRQILKQFLPSFQGLWDAYFQLINQNPYGYSNTSKILSTLLLVELKSSEVKSLLSIPDFLSAYYDSLIMEAVDPNGLYNLTQEGAIKVATLNIYAETYSNNKANYYELISAIRQNQIAGIDQIKIYINQLLMQIKLFRDDEVQLPNIYEINNNRIVLLMNLCNHIMSIFQLTPSDKFGVVYNYSRYTKEYDI